MMFKTLRSQLLGAAAVAVLVATACLMWLTYSNLSKAVRKREEKAIHTAARFIQLEIGSQFSSLLFFKADSIRHYKKDLKNTAEMFLRLSSSADMTIREVLADSGSDGEQRNAEAYWLRLVSRCLAILGRQTATLLLLDQQGKVILTSDPIFQGLDSRSFINMNEKELGSGLSGSSLSRSGEFAVFHLKRQQAKLWKLGYFVPLLGQEMVLCAVTDINDFISAEEKKKQEIIDELDSILANLDLSSRGFAFIFDRQSSILVPPAKERSTMFQQLLTDKTEFAKFIRICKSEKGNGLIESLYGGEFSVYTDCFKGFNWYFSIVLPEADIREPAARMVGMQMVGTIAAFGLCLALLAILLSRAVRPLETLSRKIEQVPNHDFTGSDHTILLNGLPLSSHNEIGRLAQSFAFMVERLSSSIKQLVETTATNERIESELNIAREIQLGTLPKDFSFEPERKALEIYAYLVPALEVGGDLYDFFFIDDDNLCFTVGDVAGKGVPAALFMVITKKLVSSNARLGCGRSPAEMMTNINEMLCKENPSAMFVTLLIGILNVKTGELRYANGGHVPPIFSPCGEAPAYRKDLSGPVVGVIPGVTYREIVAVLEPGAAVFLCTDGVTEAMNEKDELFGEKRLLDEVTILRDASCRQIVDSLLNTIRLHAGTTPQSDDIAMLMIRWGVEENKANDLQIA
jgi:sigma-B regulation protein RsbU (phosphoserine phosphatase)